MESTDLTPEDCSRREAWQELVIELPPHSLKRVAFIRFYWGDHPGNKEAIPQFEVLFHITEEVGGIPQRTSEMSCPTWFPANHMPWEEMGVADRVFTEPILQGKLVRGSVWLKENGRELYCAGSHHIEECTQAFLDSIVFKCV